jgi:ribosomal protein L36
MAGLDPAIHQKMKFTRRKMDGRVICAKTRFAL